MSETWTAGSQVLNSSLNLGKQSVPSDLWRRTIPIELKMSAYFNSSQSASSSTFQSFEINDKLQWATSLSTCPGSPLVLVGSGSSSTNLFVYEHQVSYEAPLKLKALYATPDPIKHISISGKTLLTAGLKGRVQVFNFDSSLAGVKGKGLTHLSECKIGYGELKDIAISAPGSTIASARISHVELCPGEQPMEFLAVQGKNVHIWNLSEHRAVCTSEVSADSISFANWSPHNSFIATASSDGNISLLDRNLMSSISKKGTGLVWKVDDAHQGTIKGLEFNPFIPYWLGSCGIDGTVKLWDLRYLKTPAAWLDGHFDSINSFCWSNTHCDRFATASSDSLLRSWALTSSLTVPKEKPKNWLIGDNLASESREVYASARLLAESDQESAFTYPFISITPSCVTSDCYYALNAASELTMFTIDKEATEPVGLHRYESSDNSEEYKLENLVYHRNLSQAYEMFSEYFKKQLKTNNFTPHMEAEIMQLVSSKPPISPDSWHLPLITEQDSKDSLEKFERDLLQYSIGLPPDFSRLGYWFDQIPTNIRLRFESIQLRHNLIYDIQQENIREILKVQKALITCFENDPSILECSTLMQMVYLLMKNDFMKGFETGRQLLQIVYSNSKIEFSEFSGLVHLLVYPTCFDKNELSLANVLVDLNKYTERKLAACESWIKSWSKELINTITNKALAKMNSDEKRQREIINCTSDSETAMQMMILESAIINIVLEKSGDPNKIISLLQDPSKSKTVFKLKSISLLSNLIYVDALLSKFRFDELVQISIEYISAFKGTEVPELVIKFLNNIVIPKLGDYNNQRLGQATGNISQAMKSAAFDPPPTVAASAPLALTEYMKQSHSILLSSINQMIKIGGMICNFIEQSEGHVLWDKILYEVKGMLEQTSTAIFRLHESMQVDIALSKTCSTALRNAIFEGIRLFNSNLAKEAKTLSIQTQSAPKPQSPSLLFYLTVSRLQEKTARLNMADRTVN